MNWWKRVLFFVNSSGFLYKGILPEFNVSESPLWYILLTLISYYIISTVLQVLVTKALERILSWLYLLVIWITSFSFRKLLPLVIAFVILRTMEIKYAESLSNYIRNYNVTDTVYIMNNYWNITSNYLNGYETIVEGIHNQTNTWYNMLYY